MSAELAGSVDNELVNAEEHAIVQHATGLLRVVVGGLDGRLPSAHIKNASTLLDAGEPGVALEILCDQLSEGDVPISERERAQIIEAGERMGIASRYWADLTLT